MTDMKGLKVEIRERRYPAKTGCDWTVRDGDHIFRQGEGEGDDPADALKNSLAYIAGEELDE